MDSTWRTAFIALAAAAVAGTAGYLTGRWHVKREIAGAMESAFADVGKAFRSPDAVLGHTGDSTSASVDPPKPEPKPWEGATASIANEFIKTGPASVVRDGEDCGIVVPFTSVAKTAIINVNLIEIRDEHGNKYSRDNLFNRYNAERDFWKKHSKEDDREFKIRPGETGLARVVADAPIDSAKTLHVQVIVSGDAINPDTKWLRVGIP